MSKPKATRKPKTTRYIAVVMSGTTNRSRKPAGDWAAFVSTSRKDAVEQALAAAQVWDQKGYFSYYTKPTDQRGPYFVVVGTITSRVTVPQRWALRAI